jgi:phosphoribosylanthranilate isomerase
MPLKTTVKVSHISNLSDARYCAGMGVEMLGFRVIPGEENYMPPKVFQDIRGWIAGPAIVAELYGMSSVDQLETVVGTYSPDYFELTFAEYKACRDHLTLPCMVYFPAGEFPTKELEDKISHALVDARTSCRNITSFRMPVLIKINTLSQLHDKLSEGCFKGVILEGPGEQRPGITNYEQLGEILEALEEE